MKEDTLSSKVVDSEKDDPKGEVYSTRSTWDLEISSSPFLAYGALCVCQERETEDQCMQPSATLKATETILREEGSQSQVIAIRQAGWEFWEMLIEACGISSPAYVMMGDKKTAIMSTEELGVDTSYEIPETLSSQVQIRANENLMIAWFAQTMMQGDISGVHESSIAIISDLNDMEKAGCSNTSSLVIEAHEKMRHRSGINIEGDEDDDESEDLLTDFIDEDSQLPSRVSDSALTGTTSSGNWKHEEIQVCTEMVVGEEKLNKGMEMKVLARMSRGLEWVYTMAVGEDVEEAEPRETKVTVGLRITPLVRDLNLNMQLDEMCDVTSVQSTAKQEDQCPTDIASADSTVKVKDQYPSNVMIDPMQFHVHSDRIIDQDEDDYDNEEPQDLINNLQVAWSTVLLLVQPLQIQIVDTPTWNLWMLVSELPILLLWVLELFHQMNAKQKRNSNLPLDEGDVPIRRLEEACEKALPFRDFCELRNHRGNAKPREVEHQKPRLEIPKFTGRSDRMLKIVNNYSWKIALLDDFDYDEGCEKTMQD
eukprot:Gb_03801 [translate_table: standard]